MKLCVIPARGGSKRIPRKNIRPFMGKPLIGYSIETTIQSGLFDRVIVSTDDNEIAQVAKEFGAEVPFIRPKELSDDFTTTNAVVKHAIQWYKDKGKPVDYVCCVYATAPFLNMSYLKKGLEQLISSEKSYAFSVTSFAFPIQRALRITSEGCVEAIWPENIYKRSQDLDEAYHDAGQFYWGRSEAFLDDVVTFSSASIPVILPRHLVQDIDTLEDWHRAELMYRSLQMVEESEQ